MESNLETSASPGRANQFRDLERAGTRRNQVHFSLRSSQLGVSCHPRFIVGRVRRNNDWVPSSGNGNARVQPAGGLVAMIHIGWLRLNEVVGIDG
jgi:hypothetical protein